MPPLRLGVNADHVATIRNARGGPRPDPLRAALLAIEAGADGITAHLREDRRHIQDADMARLKATIAKPLNFEMAATDQMLDIATLIAPHAVCLVPEKRTERTTEEQHATEPSEYPATAVLLIRSPVSAADTTQSRPADQVTRPSIT